VTASRRIVVTLQKECFNANVCISYVRNDYEPVRRHITPSNLRIGEDYVKKNSVVVRIDCRAGPSAERTGNRHIRRRIRFDRVGRTSRGRWGSSLNTIKLVEDARARGQQVTVDQYLYTASSTNLGARFPSWIFDGGTEKTKERLQDPTTRARIKREMIEENRKSGRTSYDYAVVASYRPDPSFNGRNIT